MNYPYTSFTNKHKPPEAKGLVENSQNIDYHKTQNYDLQYGMKLEKSLTSNPWALPMYHQKFGRVQPARNYLGRKFIRAPYSDAKQYDISNHLGSATKPNQYPYQVFTPIPFTYSA